MDLLHLQRSLKFPDLADQKPLKKKFVDFPSDRADDRGYIHWWLSPLSPLKNMTSSVGKYIYIFPIYGKIKAMFQTTKQINIQWHSHCIPSNFNIPPLLSHIFQVNPETTKNIPFIFHSYTIYNIQSLFIHYLYSILICIHNEDTSKARTRPILEAAAADSVWKTRATLLFDGSKRSSVTPRETWEIPRSRPWDFYENSYCIVFSGNST